MTISGTVNAHLLIFPYPAQGHMLPLLDLTHQLAARGLTLTVLVTPKNLPFLHPLLSAHPSIEALVFPFPSHPAIPPGVENVKDLPPDSFRAMMRSLGELHGPLTEWFRSHPSPPVAIVSDMFLGWTHRLACELGIRRIVFSPSGAMALSVIYALWRDLPKRKNPDDQNEIISFPNIPSFPKYPWWQLSPVYRRYVEGDPVMEFIKDGLLADVESWGLVVNSFSELEAVYLEHLRQEMGHDRVWAVGPLLPHDDGDSHGPKQRGGSSSVKVEDILSWLDTCEDRKLVYVCFGSQALLPKHVLDQLAFGLEKSGVRFIWSVREPTTAQVENNYGTIPSGFEDRVVGRGLVIRGWAPQVLILRHRAVGAFLTHCGWNSVLEGIVAGVPLLAWPMGADQFANASLLVDEMKVAIRVGEGAQTVPDPEELARVLVESVSENRVERNAAEDLRGAALEAIKEGGRSEREFDSMLRKLATLTLQPNT
ncbi:UDP-glycosyltransferase 89B1 [Morella rubra]|uniref:Glycosyltransferase n=1 Tax=Morella rubra TaxID=262757 RepID=A0A6A1VLH7_9ROSI|nr:UDP-glycosyltransferase 89B1 [Morella rubra]